MTSFFKLNYWAALVGLAALVFTTSCGDDDDENKSSNGTGNGTVGVLDADFTATPDGLKVTFENASTGATSYSWDFGDSKGTSTDESPVYTYATSGSYSVTLIASSASDKDTITKTVTAGDVLKELLAGTDPAGKQWSAAGGNTWGVVFGPDDMTQNDFGKAFFYWGAAAIGIGGENQQWCVRESNFNNVYTFKPDGKFEVDYKGSFWGEFALLQKEDGTSFEGNLDLVDGKIPLKNQNGKDVNAFLNPNNDWTFEISQSNLSLTGLGAFIFNPRYTGATASKDPKDGVTYELLDLVSGGAGKPDTLRFRIVVSDPDNNNTKFTNYYQLVSVVDNKLPVLDKSPCDQATGPVDLDGSISAEKVSHTFESETGKGEAILSVDGSYTVTYGETIAGKTGAKIERTDADGFADFKMRTFEVDPNNAVAAIGGNDIDFTGFMKATCEVYFPSSNTYNPGGLSDTITVKLGDVSFDQGSFWQEGNNSQVHVLVEKKDEWVSVEFDFTTYLSNAGDNAKNRDLVYILMGGQGHNETGTFYIRDFKFVQ